MFALKKCWYPSKWGSLSDIWKYLRQWAYLSKLWKCPDQFLKRFVRHRGSVFLQHWYLGGAAEKQNSNRKTSWIRIALNGDNFDFIHLQWGVVDGVACEEVSQSCEEVVAQEREAGAVGQNQRPEIRVHFHIFRGLKINRSYSTVHISGVDSSILNVTS